MDDRRVGEDGAKEEVDRESTTKVGRRATSLSPPERFLLEQWALSVADAFGERPYLVGSVARAEPWRDVDVRLMLGTHDFVQLTKAKPGRLAALNVSVSLWGQKATGLPIDFQFQVIYEANAEHDGPRHALGLMALHYGDRGPQ